MNESIKVKKTSSQAKSRTETRKQKRKIEHILGRLESVIICKINLKELRNCEIQRQQKH